MLQWSMMEKIGHFDGALFFHALQYEGADKGGINDAGVYSQYQVVQLSAFLEGGKILVWIAALLLQVVGLEGVSPCGTLELE